jgi:hypothetical protein
MNLSKTQWAEIEARLGGVFGHVRLKCDGHEISLQVEHVRRRLVVAVFIDGWIKGENIINPSDDAKKFWNHQVRFLYLGKKREELQKALRKRIMNQMPDAKAWYENALASKVKLWTPYFPSPKAVCRHLAKVCQDVELLEP